MEVTHFVVPVAAYPRYRYTRQHIIPLLKRFQKLSQKCNITDPFSIPSFGDVNIYAISDVESGILKNDEVASRCNSEIKRTCSKYKDIDEFRSQCPDDGASIHIASYKRASEIGDLFQYFGRYNVLLTKEDEQIEAKTPDENIICVKTKKQFATEASLLCERILFRELYKRVNVLAALLELDPTEAVFSTLDRDIESLLKKKYDKSRTLSALRTVPTTERDVIHLHDEWCSARLTAIRNKITTEYGKNAPEVRKQLLDLDANIINGRNISSGKICEHILPYHHDDATPSESKPIPEALSAQIKVMQKSQETTRKAVHLETRFKNHLDLVHKYRDEINQLYDESMGMYHRSKVPEYERPTRMQKKPPPLSENVAKGFLSIKGVKGCGYRFRTLNIYIKDSLTKEERHCTTEKAKEMAVNYGIMECEVRTEQEEVTKFADCGVGSALTTKTSQYKHRASLGGFALKGENRDLSLLIARHFADGCRNIYVDDTDGSKHEIAYVLKPPPDTDRHASLDIAAACVKKQLRPKCVTRFKDQSGEPLPSKLTMFEEFDIEWLKGLPVHVWGAVSSPGLGKIVIPDYYIEGMKRLVKIEDNDPVDTDIVPFCRVGDSGAIVCADDPDGEIVHVISMVMGSSNSVATENDKTIKGEYLSIRLKDGLWQLEQELGDTFELC